MRNRDQEKAIIAAATDAPWSQEMNTAWRKKLQVEPNISFCQNESDAAFIAAARTGWPEDLAWRERAEIALKTIETLLPLYGIGCPFCGGIPIVKEGSFVRYDHTKHCELAALLGEAITNVLNKLTACVGIFDSAPCNYVREISSNKGCHLEPVCCLRAGMSER